MYTQKGGYAHSSIDIYKPALSRSSKPLPVCWASLMHVQRESIQLILKSLNIRILMSSKTWCMAFRVRRDHEACPGAPSLSPFQCSPMQIPAITAAPCPAATAHQQGPLRCLLQPPAAPDRPPAPAHAGTGQGKGRQSLQPFAADFILRCYCLPVPLTPRPLQCPSG